MSKSESIATRRTLRWTESKGSEINDKTAAQSSEWQLGPPTHPGVRPKSSPPPSSPWSPLRLSPLTLTPNWPINNSMESRKGPSILGRVLENVTQTSIVALSLSADFLFISMDFMGLLHAIIYEIKSGHTILKEILIKYAWILILQHNPFIRPEICSSYFEKKNIEDVSFKTGIWKKNGSKL